MYNYINAINTRLVATPVLVALLFQTLPLIISTMLFEPQIFPYLASATDPLFQDPIVRARARDIRPLTRILWLGIYIVFLKFEVVEAYILLPAYYAWFWSFATTCPAPIWWAAPVKW